MNLIQKKFLRKPLALILCFLLLVYPSFGGFSLVVSPRVWAEDSAEEILREQQEAQREAQAEADKQARREAARLAEAERERLEAEREAVEDLAVTPTPTPTETSGLPNLESNSGATAENSQTGDNSQNFAESSADTNLDNQNQNTDTSLNQNATTTANSGNNVISGDNPPSPTPTPTTTPGDPQPLPGCEEPKETEGTVQGEENTSGQSGQNEIQETPAGGETSGGGSETLANDASSQEGTQQDNFTTDSSSENAQTGDQTVTNAESEDSDAIVAANKNCAELESDSESSATTGQNSSSGNEGGAKMETGEATSSGTMTNEGNVNTTEISGGGGAQNSQTGEGSSNFSQSEESDTLVVENDNQISVETNLSVEASSGQNLLLDNEGGVLLETGDLELFAYLLNILNMNITGRDFTHLIINIFGNLTGDVDLDDIAKKLGMDDDYIKAVARNSATGIDSLNSADAQSELDAEVRNRNAAYVRNNVDVSGVSGRNDLSGNEDLVKIYTGRIKILAAILNFINVNLSGTDWYFAMVNIFGNLRGDIFLPDPNGFLSAQEAQNLETGENSFNSAEAIASTDMAVTNQNQTQVSNNVNTTADSGTNTAYANEDQVRMASGNVSAATQILNWINYNLSGNNFVLLIVNVFGQWFGRVIAFPGKAPSIEAPENGMLMVAANGAEGQTQAVNEQTGAGSENYASSQDNLNLAVSNENSAQVENNINVEGVSGQNQTNSNDDGARAVTGWISLDVDLFNIVNFNITGRNWMVLLVNVFGNFFGNLVFPQGRQDLVATQVEETVTAAGVGVSQTLNETSQDLNENVGNLALSQSSGGENSMTTTLRPKVKRLKQVSPPINPINPISPINPINQESVVVSSQAEDGEDFSQTAASGEQPPEGGSSVSLGRSGETLLLGFVQKIPPDAPKKLPLAIYGIIYLLALKYLVLKRKIRFWDNDFEIPKI